VWARALLGLVLAGTALLVVYAWTRALRRTGRTIGTIVRIDKDVGVGGSSTLAVLSFSLDGKEYRFRTRLAWPHEVTTKSVGKKVRIACNRMIHTMAVSGTHSVGTCRRRH
jgi:hypothetical protein